MIEHTCRIRVRYAESDQMQFAHHSNYIVWFEAARIELLRAIGVNYAQMEQGGYLLPVLEVCAQYLKPARFDDELHITARIAEKPRAKCRIGYEVKTDYQLICSGHSLHGFINAQGKAIRPPGAFVQAVEKYFTSSRD